MRIHCTALAFASFISFASAYISLSSTQGQVVLESADYFGARVAYYESGPTPLLVAQPSPGCVFSPNTQASAVVALLLWTEAQQNGCDHYRQAIDGLYTAWGQRLQNILVVTPSDVLNPFREPYVARGALDSSDSTPSQAIVFTPWNDAIVKAAASPMTVSIVQETSSWTSTFSTVAITIVSWIKYAVVMLGVLSAVQFAVRSYLTKNVHLDMRLVWFLCSVLGGAAFATSIFFPILSRIRFILLTGANVFLSIAYQLVVLLLIRLITSRKQNALGMVGMGVSLVAWMGILVALYSGVNDAIYLFGGLSVGNGAILAEFWITNVMYALSVLAFAVLMLAVYKVKNVYATMPKQETHVMRQMISLSVWGMIASPFARLLLQALPLGVFALLDAGWVISPQQGLAYHLAGVVMGGMRATILLMGANFFDEKDGVVEEEARQWTRRSEASMEEARESTDQAPTLLADKPVERG